MPQQIHFNFKYYYLDLTILLENSHTYEPYIINTVHIIDIESGFLY